MSTMRPISTSRPIAPPTMMGTHGTDDVSSSADPASALGVAPRSGGSSLDGAGLGAGASVTGAKSAVGYEGTVPARACGVGSKRTHPEPVELGPRVQVVRGELPGAVGGLLGFEEPDRHPARDADDASHDRHRRGELLAVADPVFEEGQQIGATAAGGLDLGLVVAEVAVLAEPLLQQLRLLEPRRPVSGHGGGLPTDLDVEAVAPERALFIASAS